MQEKKINIIQFLPYFPPHKGGLETHAEQWGNWWIKNKYGNVYNIITDFNQDINLGEQIIYKNKIIGYTKNGVENLIIPSYEIISNFPIYKFWTKEYKLIIQYLKQQNIDIIITRTRFFLTSLIGGLFARKNKIKWIHIEHGSDYVKLNSNFKNLIAKIYDKIIGKWIFRKTNLVIPISNAVKDFIIKLGGKNINISDVIYRGLDFPKDMKLQENIKEKFYNKIIIGYVGRLYKWKNVENLIKAFYNLDKNLQNKLQLVIVGDGEDFERLKDLDNQNKIYFTGGVDFKKALSYQKQFDIHIHPSSPGGGLATTLLQAMNFGCMIIATPNEGAKEVITNNKNGFLLRNDSIEELEKGIKLALENKDKKEDFAKVNKQIIKEKFSWDENILKYYKILNDK